MKGKILDYSAASSQGVISGDDGVRYQFVGSEWKAQASPAVGMEVNFDIQGQAAVAIYSLSVAATTELSKRVITSILALVLGGFGAHKFYLGMTKPAAIMLGVWIAGYFLKGIPTTIVVIIGWVECYLYFTKTDAEFEQTYVVNKKEWF